jgi:hypothetical protein
LLSIQYKWQTPNIPWIIYCAKKKITPAVGLFYSPTRFAIGKIAAA